MRLILFLLLSLAAWAAPIPVAEIPAQLESARAHLEELRAPDGVSELPDLTTEVEAALRLMPAANPTIEETRLAAQQLKALNRRVEDAKAVLQLKSQTTSEQLARLEELRALWATTESAARFDQVPAQLVADIASWRREAAAVEGQLKARRALILSLQGDVGELDARLEEGLRSVEQTRASLERRLLSRDSPPLWSPEVYAGGMLPRALRDQGVALLSYVDLHAANFFLHLVLVAVLYWVLRRVREFVQPSCDARSALRESLRVFNEPFLLACLLSLMADGRLYPAPPPSLTAALVLVALLLAGRLLTRTLEPHLGWAALALGSLFAVDVARGLVADVPALARLLFLGEMVAGALFLGLYLASRQALLVERRKLRWGMQAACLAFAGAALANLGGYLALASLVGNAVVRSAYLGLLLMALLTILSGLALLATLVPPLRLLRSVRRYREVLHSRLQRLLALLLGFGWVAFTLEQLSLWRPLRLLVRSALTSELAVGALRLSLGGVLAFVVILFLAGLLSRLVRAVLEEDVYPRVQLGRGLPYALSMVAHYALWVLGFLAAAAAAGLDPARFTFLAGALGVGMGLGLQGIVNNFVSGLILLFERPVQVGDRVRIGDYVGTLVSVGLRASVVRTDEGAEVIVPNGELMTTKVVNLSAGNAAG